MRCLSILVTWLLALGLVYLLFSILIPELVASVSLLFSNLESYYRTIYTWVTQLVEDNPYISERVLTLVRDYYNELVDWVKNTVIPGAQVAIVAVTGGVLSVLVFAKDLLVGIVVSVYVFHKIMLNKKIQTCCIVLSNGIPVNIIHQICKVKSHCI